MSSSKSKIDPRAQRTKSKALAVAWDILLKEGADAVTHLRIAQQTGIGRNTLYRHWPERENILIEAIAMGDVIRPQPIEGTVQEKMIADLLLLGEWLESSAAPIFATLIERSEWSEEIADIKHHFEKRGSENIRNLLQEAINDKQINADLDIDFAVSFLLGPVFYRRFIAGEAISDKFIKQTVDSFFNR